MASTESALQPLLYRISDVAELLGLSQSKVYRLVREGKLRGVRVDGAIRIPRESLDQYLASLPSVSDDEDEEETQAALIP